MEKTDPITDAVSVIDGDDDDVEFVPDSEDLIKESRYKPWTSTTPGVLCSAAEIEA